MSDDKVAQKIALTRALRNVSKILRDLDGIAQDVDNVRHSIQQGFAAQAVVSASAHLDAALELLSEQYEGDYDAKHTV